MEMLIGGRWQPAVGADFLDALVPKVEAIRTGHPQSPLSQDDLMPYGALKASGIGKEGPRSAVAEMTDTKTVILHGRPW
jgi:hypothetical protein